MTEHPVTIRALRSADLASVVKIDAVQTGESKPAYWKRVFHQFLATRQEIVRVGLVAERNRHVVGFLLGDVRAFEFGSEPCGWILEIGVDPAFARVGIASRLLDEGRSQLLASGVGVVRTMVRRNNVPVLTFFRTNGFYGGPYVQLEFTPDEE